MSGQLVDLDELVLRCASEEAKQYIAEAVACYKSGAYRSCIVSTWIAVVFDFIDKLRQLELAGDPNAKRRLEEFEKIRQEHDLKKSLEFEREILNIAKDEFELVSPLEYDELTRLLEDRHRCAHPSMRSLDEPYQPTAEAARYHMRNAVTYLLQHPPTQGQAALDSLIKQLESPLFPRMNDDIKRVFQQGPLARPREALVQNFTKVLLKELIIKDHARMDYPRMMRYIGALEEVLDMHRLIVEKTCANQLSTIIRRLDDQQLGRVLEFLFYLQGQMWDFIDDDIRVKLGLFIEGLPSEEIETSLWHALGIDALRTHALTRLKDVVDNELPLLFVEPAEEVVDKAVKSYAESRNWDHANEKAKRLIIPVVNHLQDRHIEHILTAAFDNYEVFGSRELVPILFAIKDAQGDHFQKFVPLVVELREKADEKYGPRNPFRRFMPSADSPQTEAE